MELGFEAFDHIIGVDGIGQVGGVAADRGREHRLGDLHVCKRRMSNSTRWASKSVVSLTVLAEGPALAHRAQTEESGAGLAAQTGAAEPAGIRFAHWPLAEGPGEARRAVTEPRTTPENAKVSGG